MHFYPAARAAVTFSGEDAAGLAVLGRGGLVAVRAADLAWPARLGGDGRSARVAAGPGKVRTGDVVVFFKPVAVTRAVVRRDGRVQAAGHPSDHARLGAAEARLDELAGQPDVIGAIAAGLEPGGKVKGRARRAMTPELAIRMILLMTLMPGADYPEVMSALLGDLLLVPWRRPYRAPTATVASTWRDAVGPGPLEKLRDRVLAGTDTAHHDHDWRAVIVGDLDICSIDGSLTRVPDSPANRAAYGSAGTADDSSPYPQLRELRLSHASTRSVLGVTTGPAGGCAGAGRDKGEAEQILLDKALDDYPALFTPGRLWVMDRNFPGVTRIKRMLATGTHVLIRLRDGIALRRTGEFLPDGSYLAQISGGGQTLTVRVIEYTVSVAGRDAPELFCLITDLADHRAYPAPVLAGAYHWRWVGSETCLKEAKSAITGAGPSTGPMLRSQSPRLVRQEHAAWITATELARAVIRAAARVAIPARKGQRAGQPVHLREISFTAARRAIITATRAGAATASLPATAVTSADDRILADLARRRVSVDRDRHRQRKTKARQPFPPGPPSMPTLTAPARITTCQPIPAAGPPAPSPSCRSHGPSPSRPPTRQAPPAPPVTHRRPSRPAAAASLATSRSTRTR